MTPEQYARHKQEMQRNQEKRDREGAKKLGISVAQFRSLKARAVRRVGPQPTAPAPAKSFRGKVFQTVAFYSDGTRQVIK